MRYRLRHATTYTYDRSVRTSYGRAHLVPRDEPGQRLVSSDLTIDPGAAEIREHIDFFGNRASYFEVRKAHTRLQVVSESVVEVERMRFDPHTMPTALTWEQARDAFDGGAPAREFLLGSAQIGLLPGVRQYADSVFVPALPVADALARLCSRIHSDFQYRAGATTVHSTLTDVLERRSGVCQDFAHLAVGCLRTVGLPARYVSGYLETVPPPGQAKLQGADASHAWASVLLPRIGWVDLDPTNDQFIDDRYVVLARGRDYSDVPPLKGVIMTDARSSTMQVNVDVTPIPHPEPAIG